MPVKDFPDVKVVINIDNSTTVINNYTVSIVNEIAPRRVTYDNRSYTEYTVIMGGGWYDGYWSDGKFVPKAAYPKTVQTVAAAQATPQVAKGMPTGYYQTGDEPALASASDPWYENTGMMMGAAVAFVVAAIGVSWLGGRFRRRLKG